MALFKHKGGSLQTWNADGSKAEVFCVYCMGIVRKDKCTICKRVQPK